jgi:hypothetical protein
VIGFLPLELPRWDEARADALIVTLFKDERPLRGATGLCDWRLCGRLSRLVRTGRLVGAEGETLLMPPGRRLPFGRILAVGLGKQTRFDDETYRRHVRNIRDVARRAGMTDYAIQPPGRATGLIAARRALELWIEAGDAADERALIIDTPTAHKDMSDILHLRERPRRDSGAPPS